MTRHLVLQEAKLHAGVEITSDEARWLIDQNLASVSPSQQEGCFDVRVNNVVGVTRYGQLQVTIQPKLLIGDAIDLIAYSQGIDVWRAESAELGASGFTVVLAGLYRQLLEDALRYGVAQGYRNVDTSGPLLRGRIRLPEQLARHHGRLIPFEMSYEEFGPDVAENRILLAALRKVLEALAAERSDEGSRTRLHTKPVHVSPVRRHEPLEEEIEKLGRLIPLFRDVGPLDDGSPLPGWTPTRLNEHLIPALRLAELVLGRGGVDAQHGNVQGSGLVIEMWRVFEAAVARAMKEAFPGLHVETQFSSQISDVGVKIRPDLVLLRDGHPVAVMDTKYKSFSRQSTLSRDDLFQAISYATIFGLPEVTLLYADPSPEKVIQVRTNANKEEITVRLLGLDVTGAADRKLVERLSLSLCFLRRIA